MKYITYLNILSRLIFTVCIFIFVAKKSDYYLVPLLTSLGYIVAGIWSMLIIKREFGISFSIQSPKIILHYLQEAKHIFASNAAISLYTISTTFILGIFTNNTIVGYFAAADKVIQAFKGLIVPAMQASYPYINKQFQKSTELGVATVRKISLFIGAATLFISILICLLASQIVQILLGEGYENSVLLLQIMSSLPFLVGLSNIFGIQTMLSLGRKKAFSQIVLFGSGLSLTLSFLLVPSFGAVGSSISVVVVELFITLTMLIYLQTNGIKMITTKR